LALALSSALHLPRHRFRSFWWISSRPDSPLECTDRTPACRDTISPCRACRSRCHNCRLRAHYRRA